LTTSWRALPHVWLIEQQLMTYARLLLLLLLVVM